MLLADVVLQYLVKQELSIERKLSAKLSNGDANTIHYLLKASFRFTPKLQIIDEFPEQLQLRHESIDVPIQGKSLNETVLYTIYPKTRGEYKFGAIKLMIETPIGLLLRLKHVAAENTVKVYPSIVQYKKFSFLAQNNRLEEAGVKKLRKLGSSTEFDQIKEFNRGDDVKRINWRATARRKQLMVNHYEDERAQNIYFLIDKGRMMHMPFNGLTLLDYSINSCLSLAGVAKGKGDKIGLITFSDVIGSWVPAKAKTSQLGLINEALYHQKIRSKETDFSRLYRNVRTRVNQRSMLILFSNFDSMVSLRRQLKYLKALARNHLLLIVSFENEEVKQLAHQVSSTEKEFYDQSIAERFIQEKQRIINELKVAGIHALLTSPEDLTVNSINKYLEIKSRNLL